MNMISEPTNLIELVKQLKQKGIPESEWGGYYGRFLEKKARKHGIPLNGSFELTPFCNLDCKMCYVHLSPVQFDRNQLLTVDQWKQIILQAHQVGMRNASLTGGECLTYPGFFDVYLYLYHLGIRPGILTNSVLINESHLDLFRRYPPRMIQVSLYGSSDDAYERVTGHRVFHSVIQKLEILRDSHVPVKITITPNSYMREDIIPLLELIQSLNIPSNVNANLILPRKNTGRTVHDLSVDEYVNLFKARVAMNHGVLTPVDPVELPDESYKETSKRGLLCGAGRSSFGVKFDGGLCPCLSLDEFSVDLLSHDFLSAWKKVNEFANNYPLPAECGECVYMGRCLPCIAMHKNAPVPGHCDPRICERTKKFMAAGFIPLPENGRIPNNAE